MMHGPGKSDSAIVARKPTNKAGQPAAEPVERRAEAKGNAHQQSTCRAQDRESVSQALERIRQAARQRKKERFTSLFHHLSIELLRVSFFALKREAAPGVDGLTWRDYEWTSIVGSRTCTHGSIEEHIGLCHPGDGTYRKPMDNSARSRWPPWRTKSSKERPARC